MSTGDYERRQRAVVCGLNWESIELRLNQVGISFFGKSRVVDIMNTLIRLNEFCDTFSTKERLWIAVEAGAALAGGSSHCNV